MINGVPCVTSDLPGVRQPVIRHGMGKIIPIGDSAALAGSVLEILAQPENFRAPADGIASTYHSESIAEEYERLFEEIFVELGKHEENKRIAM
jgi:glycosyltransferase involved in cell wall biosynthesis